MALSSEQKGFFQENGYVSYGPVLTAPEVEELREEYDAVFRRAKRDQTYRNLSAAASATAEPPKKSRTQMLQIMQMCERSLLFRKLLYHPMILDVVQDLLGPDIMLFHDQALWKPAHTGGPVHWHQDNAYWRCDPANLVSCWLTLDDVVKENGAMQLIPGSHRAVASHGRSSTSAALLESTEVDASKAVAVELPAGGCMFHHCQTLHYTQPNATDRQRRALAIHFMAPGTRNREGAIMRAGFDRPVLRLDR